LTPWASSKDFSVFFKVPKSELRSEMVETAARVDEARLLSFEMGCWLALTNPEMIDSVSIPEPMPPKLIVPAMSIHRVIKQLPCQESPIVPGLRATPARGRCRYPSRPNANCGSWLA